MPASQGRRGGWWGGQQQQPAQRGGQEHPPGDLSLKQQILKHPLSCQVVEVQPEATSTPKVLRRIEPLPEDRDLGDSSNSDSLESELEVFI